MTEFFESFYYGFLKTVPAIEAIWETKNQKPKLIIADAFAVHARYLARKHSIPLLVFYSTYFYFNISDNQSRKKILEEFQSQAREELLTPLEEEMEAKYNVRINW